MELVIGSNHSGTIYELRYALKELIPRLSVLSLFDFPKHPLSDPSVLATTLNRSILTEHSTLMVPKLQCEFPTLSDCPSAETKKLLALLEGSVEEERFAYLTSTLTLFTPSGRCHQTSQRMEGFLSNEEKGSTTFAFDTIFIKHDYLKTLGEIEATLRARISPRRKALERLLPVLERQMK